MNNYIERIIVIFVITMSGGYSSSDDNNMKTWQTYRVNIPHFVIELRIPPELERGYAQFKTEVIFESPPNPQSTFSFGNGIYRKDVGGFYLGAKRDFGSWDLTVNIFVIKYENDKRPIRSSEDLIEFARNILAEEYTLADGTVVDDYGSITVDKMGDRDVVVATRADPYRNRSVKIKDAKGNSTDLTQSESPYQLYYLRLDNEIAVGLQVFHDNQKKLNPKWYAESHTRITKIIENMKVEPRKSENQ